MNVDQVKSSLYCYAKTITVEQIDTRYNQRMDIHAYHIYTRVNQEQLHQQWSKSTKRFA